MTKPLEIIVLGDREIEINGHKLQAKVSASVYFDGYYEVDEDFENESQKQEFLNKLNNGSLTPCVLIVHTTAVNLEGTDSIGAVIVAKPEDIQDTIKEYEMVDAALKNLVKNIHNQILVLKKLL